MGTSEPWLPGGFEVGAQWYSYDNGLTWERVPDFRRVRGEPGEAVMTVTAIDEAAGMVTVVTARRVPRDPRQT